MAIWRNGQPLDLGCGAQSLESCIRYFQKIIRGWLESRYATKTTICRNMAALQMPGPRGNIIRVISSRWVGHGKIIQSLSITSTLGMRLSDQGLEIGYSSAAGVPRSPVQHSDIVTLKCTGIVFQLPDLLLVAKWYGTSPKRLKRIELSKSSLL